MNIYKEFLTQLQDFSSFSDKELKEFEHATEITKLFRTIRAEGPVWMAFATRSTDTSLTLHQEPVVMKTIKANTLQDAKNKIDEILINTLLKIREDKDTHPSYYDFAIAPMGYTSNSTLKVVVNTELLTDKIIYGKYGNMFLDTGVLFMPYNVMTKDDGTILYRYAIHDSFPGVSDYYLIRSIYA